MTLETWRVSRTVHLVWRCWCGRRRLLPWSCGRCRRQRRQWRRDYLARAAPQDALHEMTLPRKPDVSE